MTDGERSKQGERGEQGETGGQDEQGERSARRAATTRRRKADRKLAPVVITTDDGVVLRCSISAIGREVEPRWVVMDAAGRQFMGPPVETDKSPEAVARVVNEWWRAIHPPAAPEEP